MYFVRCCSTVQSSYSKLISRLTTEKAFTRSGRSIPTLQLFDKNSQFKIKNYAAPAFISNEKIVDIYKKCVKLTVYDTILYESQRQGRISFYMTCTGEEISTVGSAAALGPQDLVYSQYREQGVLFYREAPIDVMVHQLFGTRKDLTKGRQMPVHYSFPELNFMSVSSPLATQLPQAAGTAYAFKQKQLNDSKSLSTIVACYFGEGAASEGDFHAALNFAATLKCPVLFICRNNQYAISTGTEDQYSSDGIAGRAASYGIDTMRVDGNDVFAVMESVQQAREKILETGEPAFIEFVNYREGHHSTSDDSTTYRSLEEINYFKNEYNGVSRLRKYLLEQGLVTEQEEAALKESFKQEIIRLIKEAETHEMPALDEAFNDLYDKPTPRLEKQRAELRDFLDRYPEAYSDLHLYK